MHHNTSDTSNSQNQDLSTDTLINNANNSAFNSEIYNRNNLGIHILLYFLMCIEFCMLHI